MTLLEVLAAVALLGIVFTALSRSATLGVLSEGDSRRRLEASLLADTKLAQLELAVGAGAVPELGVVEDEQDGFTLITETLPWTLPPRLAEERELRIGAPSEVFGNPLQGQDGLVREIRIEVAWDDGVQERSVTRTTYAVDFAAAEGLDLPLAGLVGAGLQDALDAATGEGDGAAGPEDGEGLR